MPQSFRGRVEAALDHRIKAARAFSARDHPPLIAQNLEMPTDGRLRELEHRAELPDHELAAVEEQENSAPRRISEGADAVEDRNGQGGGGRRQDGWPEEISQYPDE